MFLLSAFCFAPLKEDGDTGPIEEFLSEAVKGNCEGLMVKTLTVSIFEASARLRYYLFFRFSLHLGASSFPSSR